MLTYATKKSSKKEVRSSGRTILETLETRQLFSLLGVLPGLPNTSIGGGDGSLTYSASTHSFDAVGVPSDILLSLDPFNDVSIGTPSSFDLHITVNNNGSATSGTQTNDLVLTGSVDVNGDGVADYTGVLLTGKLESNGFGYQANGANSDFDFRFQVTGGQLAPTYFTGSDIGVAFSTENSTFTDFNSDFSALVKGTVGTIPPQGGSSPISISGHKYVDQTGDGLSTDDMTHPLAKVTIQLYSDTNGNGVVDSHDTLVTSTMTATDGSYSFTGLAAGNYLIKEVAVSGYIETGPASGVYSVAATSGAYGGFNFDNYKMTGCNCMCGCGSTLTTATGSLSGTVFQDCDGDGVMDRNESGISGVKITLTGTDLLGNSVSKTLTTDSYGNYKFSGLIAGNYTITETQPSSYTDGKDSVGTLGGTLGNDTIQNITVPPCGNGTCYNFGEVKSTSVCGNSGHGCCKVVLTGCDAWGRSCCYTTYTDSCGNYSFGNLCGGNFKVQECDSHNNCSSQKSFCLDTSSCQGKSYNVSNICGNNNSYSNSCSSLLSLISSLFSCWF